jgi:ribonuclease R
MTELPLQQRLLDHVHRPDYQPVKPSVIARQLDLDADDRQLLKRLIKRLIKQGKISFGPGHLVVTAAARPAAKNEVIGVLRKAAAGFGFVTAQRGSGAEDQADVFIAADKLRDAADGDTVRARLSARRDRLRRQSGEIVEVVQRRTLRFVGSYLERGTSGYVQLDGGEFEKDVWVGDAGAKNCRVGDKVVVEMVHFPTSYRTGEAVILEVLGARGRPGVDTLTVIHQYQLPGEFPTSVLEDARRQAELFDGALGHRRTDFTKDTVITIDPREARDFDDAISLTRLERGHWRLGVHIADVSHFVRADSPLDLEARKRGTSVYLPDRVIPMLPETISNNLASLQPGRLRYTLSAVIEFDPAGRPVGADWFRGAIRSAHRFTYEEIDDYLANERAWKSKLSPAVFELVRDMHTLAMILRRKRLKHGAIELHLPEVKIDLDDDGRVSGATLQQNTESHQIIEEFMLAANEAVARKLAVDHSLNLLRRIHEPPSPLKLRQLTEFVQSLGLSCDSLESRFEIKRLIEQTAGRPESAAVNVTVLRSMQKAVYSPRDVGHYALNSDYYCHFTSPIRRYPDLVIHRMVGDLIDERRPVDDFQQLTQVGNQCSELEQRAERAERDLIRLKLLNYLAERVGMEMSAVVTGVEAIGLFALCDQLPVDGLIPVGSLPRDRYHFDRASRSLTGHRAGHSFRTGDQISVRVALVDPDRRELELELVERHPPRRPREKSGRPAKIRKSAKPSRRKVSKARRKRRRRR